MLDIIINEIKEEAELIEKVNKQQDDIWRERPVDLITFFTSKDFLNEKPYPGKQTQTLEIVNGLINIDWIDEIKKQEVRDIILEISNKDNIDIQQLKHVTELVLMFGKGSGKDWLASGIVAYMAYWLCCLKDPQGYFNFAQGENIDIINVATNAKQAKNVFFKKLKARLRSCKWFKKVKVRPDYEEWPYNVYVEQESQILFHKNITAHSAHSEGEGWEGYNPILIIFDEIDGFKTQEKANEIYDIMRSSGSTRYNEKILLIFISYPRSEDNFMFKKYEEGKEDPEVIAIKGTSFEVNPSITRESKEKDYRRDPEKAQMIYECIPPKQEEGYFKFPEKIAECISDREQAAIIEPKIVTRIVNGTEKKYVALELKNLSLNPEYKYYIGGDAGIDNDSYALCLAHAVPVQIIDYDEQGNKVKKWANKMVEDLLLEWKPDNKNRYPVDVLNVASIINQVCDAVTVKKMLFDKFDSEEIIQRAIAKGIDAENKVFSNPFQLKIYSSLKAMIYTNTIDLVPYEKMWKGKLIDFGCLQLQKLKLIDGKKIDHGEEGKDLSDARAICAYLINSDEVEEPTEIVRFNKNMFWDRR